MMVFHKQSSEESSWSMIIYDYMNEGKNKHHNLLTPSRCARTMLEACSIQQLHIRRLTHSLTHLLVRMLGYHTWTLIYVHA